jgi:hypothetical protein
MNINCVGPNLDANWLKNASDNDLQRLASAKAAIDTSDKRHKNLSNLLYGAAPVAAGVAAALNDNIAISTIGKTGFGLTGKAARLANGLKVGGGFALALGLVNLVSKKNESLIKNSQTVRDFEQKHPLTTTIGLVAASFGAIKGGEVLGRLISARVPDKAANTIVEAVHSAGRDINKSIILEKIAEAARKVAGKTHPALKQAGSTALKYMPLALLIGGTLHSVDHSAIRNKQAVKNYFDLKALQSMI